jgi:ABC-2 type transport system ATP-binding protein
VEQELAIQTHALAKAFGKVLAVDGLDLEVPSGGVFGLLGPSGAGKSTTLRLLAGRLRATSGSATVAGVPVAFDRADLRRRIGMLDERPGLYGWMTGWELLAFAASLAGVARADLDGRVNQTLERVGLLDAGGERIARYSSSMRTRVAIGQAVIGEPEVLLLDDPLGGLDPAARGEIVALLRDLGTQATVVMTTREPADAEAACDRVAILERGRMVPSP